MSADDDFFLANGSKFTYSPQYGAMFGKHVNITCIGDIPGIVDFGDKIRDLAIVESPMTSLDGIGMLANLEKAWFSNRLQSLEGIQACTKLQFLKAGDNEIDSMAPLAPLMQIQAIELQNNRIECIDGLEGKSALKQLNLDNNHISKIDGLNDCVQLETFYINNNCIKKIQNLDTLASLKNLRLGQNKITRIENLDILPSLEYIGLQINPIEYIENLESIVAEVGLGGNKECVDTEFISYNRNAVLCCAFKDGLDRMCTDLETRVADHVANQLASQGFIGNVIPEPRQHADSYLHVGDAFLRVSGHPAGEEIDVNTYYGRVMDKGGSNSEHVRELATRVLGAIVRTACFFGMFEDWDKDVSSLVPFTNYVEDLDLVPDVRGWAAFLRRGAAPILTLRWPEWPISDWNGMISNDIVVINESVKSRWRYMKGAFYFLSREGPIIKEFFGRTDADRRAADIHVFKEKDVAGLSWDDFLARLESFRTMGRDQYHVFHTVDNFREFLKKTL
ncbi:MAG TPA: leucine-rich repeat domain-containing protein [Candidatus Lokiarchaeia archaeon]|nr:leucine-rich repeat domain-containing protein [Candidatus Lokiarchaeia archaeon]